MGNIRLNILFFAGLLLLSSCEKFEIKGFFGAYESANERFHSSMEYNALSPKNDLVISDSSYFLSVMGDSHVGGTKNLDAFFSESMAQSVTAAVLNGDLTTGHKEDYYTFIAHVPDPQVLSSFAVTGNHDLYFSGWEHYSELFGSSSYYFSVETNKGSDLLIFLDTGSGTLGSDQLEWFRNVRKDERPLHRYCLVFTHNNILRLRPTTSTNPFVEEVQVLLDLSVKYSIDMFITAHDHKKNVDKFGNTTHIILDALSDETENAGYLLLDVNPDEINYQFVNF